MRNFLNKYAAINLETYFYQLADQSQDVFWMRSADFSQQLYINAAYEKIWGRTCQSLYEAPSTWIEAIVAEDRARVLAFFKQVPLSTDVYHIDYRIISLNKQIRQIKEVVFPLFDNTQQFIGYAGIAKEVQQDPEEIIASALKASRFFHYFTEKIPVVFWAREVQCEHQLYVSPAYEKVWGRSCESLYADPEAWINTLHPEDRDSHSAEARLQLLQEKGAAMEYEDRYRVLHPDGKTVWIKDTSFPIYDDKNVFIGFAGIAEDITKEVLHQQELEDARQRAEIANQAKADFLAMMSHELRTPLNAILGMAQILRTKDLPAELTECIEIILQAGQGLLSLVNDILDFAKLEVGKLSFSSDPFDLQLLIAQVIFSLKHLAKEKDLILSLGYEETVPSLVVGDAKRIRQILINLINNAIKFTEHGTIKIEVDCQKKTKKEVNFLLKVIDTGIGIPAEKLDFVFEKFSQLNLNPQRKNTGTGLGLAITKELVETMGGKIEVVSEVGKGSTFSFNLPLTLQEGALEKPMQSYALPEKYHCHLRALLIEDNSINQKIAKIMLEEVGCEADIVDSGLAALEKLAHDKNYDIIFMDIGLPDMSGFDVATAIQKQPELADIPIVAMTAHILARDKQRCYEVGMVNIIAKPLTHNELVAILKSSKRLRKSGR